MLTLKGLLIKPSHFVTDVIEDSEDEDEEFFDCEADAADTLASGETLPQRHRIKHSLWNKPVGRLKRCDNLRLFHSGDPLYIPITQVIVCLLFSTQKKLFLNNVLA